MSQRNKIREGMVSLNAVGKMYNLAVVDKHISKVLSVASFTEGNSYFDFNPKIDNVGHQEDTKSIIHSGLNRREEKDVDVRQCELFVS